VGLGRCLLGFSKLRFILPAEILGAGAEAILHIALGLFNPALDLGDSKIILTSHFSDRGLALIT
jgi:hypothetical protein